MSCYYNEYKGALMLRCNACGKTEELYKGETDRLLKHGWMKEHGWKTRKTVYGEWIDLCPDCIAAEEEHRRKEFVEGRA